MDRSLIRADSYVIRRQVFHVDLIDPDLTTDPENPEPFVMNGSTINMTWKPEITDPIEDPDDENAPIKGSITFDADGNVTASSLLILPPGMDASQGVLWLTMTKAQTLALPLGTTLNGDMQVTDANGEDITIPVLYTVTASDSYTNRSGGV